MYTSQPLKKFRPRFISAEVPVTDQWQSAGFEERSETPLYIVPLTSTTPTTMEGTEEEKKFKITSLREDRMNLLYLCDDKPKPLNLDFRTLSSLPLPEVRSYPCPSSLPRSSMLYKRSLVVNSDPPKSSKSTKKRALAKTLSTTIPMTTITTTTTITNKSSPATSSPSTASPKSLPQPPSTTTTEMLVHVLYAEDSEVCRILVTKTISQLAGFKCDTAFDGIDCCKKIEENPKHYQLILMDLIMPGMDGINATMRIRNLGLNIPIVAITGATSGIMKQDCDVAGMNGFIEKPLTLQKFKTILDEQKILISGY